MNYIVSADKITNFIPQRPPFVMVGNLVCNDALSANSNFHIKESNILVKEGKLTVMGLLENIAQTAAANVGHECATKNMPIPVGFIGAISRVQVSYLPLVNSEIDTRIEIKHEIFNITLIEGEVTQNGKTIISCEMKIMVDKNQE